MDQRGVAPAVVVLILVVIVGVVWGIIFFARGGGTPENAGGGTPSGTENVSIQLTHVGSYTMTPTSNYRTGVFNRLFYDTSKNKFYLTLSGIRVGATDNTFTNWDYAYYELDSYLNQTGVSGAIPVMFQGDYAIASDGTYYYFVTDHPQGWRLAKLTSDFQKVNEVVVGWDKNQEAGNDQLMNYTNGKLYMATLYDTQGTGEGYFTGMHPGMTYPHIFVYDTFLQHLENRYLLDESNIPAGGSIIFNDNKYHMVTADKMSGATSRLYVYQWDSNWNYLGKKLLASDGQWSQGLLYENGLYYVAYHVGEHECGNVVLAIYDDNWNRVTSVNVTEYSTTSSTTYNAQRPWIIKVGDRLYVSYDVAPVVGRHEVIYNWQCHIDVYTVSVQ
jgi:hypothetical protein